MWLSAGFSRSSGSRGPVSPARACAFAVVRRVFEQGAYADRAFAAEAAGLAPRERSLAKALTYGVVQRRATLDFVAGQLCSRPVESLDPAVLAALRLGLLQLLYLDGIAEHAAVHQSVELAKRGGVGGGAGGAGGGRGGVGSGRGGAAAGRGGAGLVNAVLRRAAREGRAVVASLSDATAEGAATMHSVPVWLAELWWRELGAERARALLGRVNEPGESVVRVNTLVASREEVQAQLPVAASHVAGLPGALVLQAPFDVEGSELFRRGAIFPQSRASMLAARALSPGPGARVLDLCAAPGGKTSYLAALMGDEGELVAVERHPGRARALERTLARMRVGCVRVEVADAVSFSAGAGGRFDAVSSSAGGGGRFDAVLVDPPCSGLGTLQSRPDLRWRASPERIAELSSLQAAILRAGADAVAPGGVLVYSVCTISLAEGRDVVRSLLDARPGFVVEELSALLPAAAEGPFLQTMPDRDGTDGFFIARLRKELP